MLSSHAKTHLPRWLTMLCECHCTCYSNEMTLTCFEGVKKMQLIEFIFFFSFFVFEKKRHLVTVWSFASLKMHQIQWNKKQNKDKWMYLIVDNFILVLDGRGKGKLICYTHALALSSQKKFKCIFFWMTWLDDCCK